LPAIIFSVNSSLYFEDGFGRKNIIAMVIAKKTDLQQYLTEWLSGDCLALGCWLIPNWYN